MQRPAKGNRKMEQKVIDTVITGMTKGELAAVIGIVLIAYSTLIAALSYIMKLHLKPLQEVPKQLTDLQQKVKSGEDLNRMIDVKIQYHELSCPVRQGLIMKKESLK